MEPAARDAEGKARIQRSRASGRIFERHAASAVRDDARDACSLRVMGAFQRSGDAQLQGRALRMAECSTTWGHYATADGSGSLRPFCCDDRLCSVCTHHRNRGLRKTLQALVPRARTRFLTLTQPVRPGESCADGRKRLMRAWRKLWRAQKRSSHPFLRGGLRRVEVTWSRHEGWHWHLHVLAHGEFIEQTELSQVWLGCTGDGYVVDVREVKHAAYAVAELTKYVLKVADLPENRIVEYAQAIRGLRDVQTFGDWYHAEGLEEETGEETGEAAALVQPEDVAVVKSSDAAAADVSDEVRLAVRRLAEAVGGPSVDDLPAWRAWAASVWRDWGEEVRRRRVASSRRARGRARRARRGTRNRTYH